MREDAARESFAAVERAAHRGFDDRAAVALDETAQPLLGLGQRGDAGGDVAPIERGDAAIVGEDVPEFRIERALAEEAHRAQAQALLEDFRVLHVDAARRVAADIGAMDEGPGEAEQLARDEDRAEEIDVVQMHHHAGRRIGVVGDEDVALTPIGESLRGGAAIDAHQGRRAAAVGIGEHLAFGGHERDAEILRLLDEGRVRGAQHDPRHLVDDRLEEIGEYLDADRVLAVRSCHVSPRLSFEDERPR